MKVSYYHFMTECRWLVFLGFAVISEGSLMVCARVIGHDSAIALCLTLASLNHDALQVDKCSYRSHERIQRKDRRMPDA